MNCKILSTPRWSVALEESWSLDLLANFLDFKNGYLLFIYSFFLLFIMNLSCKIWIKPFGLIALSII